MIPGLLREYGVKPWELDLFTDAELAQIALDEQRRAELQDPDSRTNKAHERRQKAAQARVDRAIHRPE